MTGQGSFGRAVLMGALLGVLAIVVLVVAALLGGRDVGSYRGDGVPSEVLVIAVTRDASDATIAGTVARVHQDGSHEIVDPDLVVAIPGTSYNHLKDAYAFGGGAAVSSALAAATGEEPLPWVVVPVETWIRIVDDAGGVEVDVPSDTNVFVNDVLYLIPAGSDRLSGGELFALGASASDADTQTVAALSAVVSDARARVLIQEWSRIAEAVESGEARSSLPAEQLRTFGATLGAPS